MTIRQHKLVSNREADESNSLNNFAITAEGIGSAVERAGASLSAAGNDIYESAALITGGNEIVQDAEQVGTALRVVSLRIRGAKAELESMGESTDDLVDSTSKLREQIQALTGVDIMLDDNTFKSTYQILDEISEVWGELTDVSAAATLELLGGKMRSNIVASMLENFDTSRAALDAARNSAGSAAKENAAYAESIEGHLNKLSNTWQEIWQNTATRDQVNVFIDMATGASKLVDQIGLINVGLGAMGGLLSAQSGVGRGKMFPLMNMPTATGGDTERVKASGFYKGTLRKQPKLILNVWQVGDLVREPIFGIRNEAV